MNAAPALPGVFASLAPLLSSYGYLAVAGFLLAENAGVPLPGETILIAAAVYAGAGQLNIAVVAVVAIVACVIGDNAAYALGHFGGRPAVLKYGRYVLLTEERLDTAEAFFDRHGGKVVTIARFVAGLRQANGIIAGTTGMPWRRFLLFNTLGAVLWVAVWSATGYLAGNNIQVVYDTVRRYSLLTVAVLVGVAGLFLARHLLRRRRQSPREEPSQP